MPYQLSIHGITIEASTAEEALALAELYATRQSERQSVVRSRTARPVPEPASAEAPPEIRERKPKPQAPLLSKLQPKQVEALQAIASGGKDGLTDEELCAKLGVQGSSLGGTLSAISKHARGLDIRFEGELIAKDPITTEAGKRGYRYIPLPALNSLLRTLKSEMA